MMVLENAMTYGTPILLENVTEEIDTFFIPLLEKKIVKGVFKYGEKMLDYNDDFKFYITTKLNRPHYTPEICVLVTMLNF